MHDTPIATLVEFLHALEVHDETDGLAPAISSWHAAYMRLSLRCSK